MEPPFSQVPMPLRPPPPAPPKAGPRWTGPRPFIGAATLVDQLHEHLRLARTGAGRAVFVHGPEGSGRAALVREFEKQARRDHRSLKTAIGDAADPDAPAWRQIAFRFTATRRVGVALQRSFADIVDLVPVVGGVLSALVETINALRPKRRRTEDPEVLGTGSTVDQVRMLFVHGRGDSRLIILENLEASDPDELAGAFALIQRLPKTRTLFVCTSLSQAGRLPSMVSDLLREAERQSVGHAIEIPRLTPMDVVTGLREATGEAVPQPWADWLQHAAPATPEQLWELLGDAIESGDLAHDGRRWVWNAAGPPADADAIIPITDAELAGLSPDDVALLACAGAIGPVFDARALAVATGYDDLRLEDRLARLVRRQLIALTETIGSGDDLIDVYGFVQPKDARRWAALARADVRTSGS